MGVPQRPPLAYGAHEVTPQDAVTLSSPGIRRDWQGIPIADASRDMHQYKAVGLGDEPGVYHEMSRGDPAIAGVFGLIDRAAGSATYVCEIEADGGPPLDDEEKETEDLCRRFYGIDGTDGWLEGGISRLMVQTGDSQRYGFVPFEVTAQPQVWRGQDTWAPSRVTRIAPSSVYSWIWHRDQLAGLAQLTPSLHGYFTPLARKLIPVWKMLLLTHQHRDGNPGGTSLIRPVVASFTAKKETMFRMQLAEENQFGGTITVEQRLDENGTPIVGTTDDPVDRENIDSMRALYESGDLGWREPPPGYILTEDHPEYQIPSRVPELEYFNREIFLTLHAVFFGLGSAGGSSANLSGDMLTMLYSSLKAIVDENLRTINGLAGVSSSGLTRRIVDWHFGYKPDRRYPRLRADGIEHRDLGQYVDAFTKAYQYYLATRHPEDEMALRRQFKLPFIPLDKITAAIARTQISQVGTQAPVQAPLGGTPS